MSNSIHILKNSAHISRKLFGICAILIIGWLCGNYITLHAEPWKCGTPLLCQHIPPANLQNRTGINNILAAPAAPAKKGQIDRFFIHIPTASIKAKCVAVGAHCYIYIDETFQDMLTDNEAEAVADTFDTKIYSEVHHWIGSEFQPGLDRDNKITILFHDVGMNMSARDYGGYFSPIDQHPTYPTSNRRDMLYLDIFQFKQRSRHTFYSSLAHEFAHLVNWYQNGGTTDQRWLEEGIASLTEWGVYGTVHTLFVDGYLAEPSISLTTANNFESYYGAAFMFLLYLYENHGGIDFIRRLAAEDSLGLPAINTSLGDNKNIVDVFLYWCIANWLNNPVNGRQLSYQNLPNRKVTKRTSRIARFPYMSDDIPIDSWGVEYILFQNLPENLELTLISNNQSKLYANIAYFEPNRNRPIITPVPSVPEPNNPNNQGINKMELSHLKREGEILLIVTSEYPQSFRYLAIQGEGNAAINILQNTPERNINPLDGQWMPNTVTFPSKSNTEMINTIRNVGISLIPSDNFPKLEPMTQIHLSSNYYEIVIQDDKAFAASDWGVEIFTLNPSPIHIGEIETPGIAQAIAIDGDNVYIADGESGIHVIDVNQPTSPLLLKTLSGLQDALDVYISDGNLYALDAVRGLLIYDQQDIHNHDKPQPRRTFQTAGTPLNVSTNDDGTIYLSDNAQGLYILTPDQLGGFTVNGIVSILATDFDILGNFVLVASGDLRIMNFANLIAPRIVSQANTPGNVSSINFFQELLYLTDRQSGLQIVNVNNTNSPRVISSIPTFGNAEDVALWYSDTDKGTYAYVADGKGGIQTIDVTHPDIPTWVNHYHTGGIAYSLDVEDNGVNTTIAIANGIGGLKTAELTDPYNGEISQVTRSFDGEQGALSVHLQNPYVYVGIENGMDVINIRTGEKLVHIPTTHPVWDITLIQDYAYLCAKDLIVVDIKDLARSQIVSQRNLPGSVYRMTHNASHVYIASLDGGVQILDIEDPAQPRPISQYNTIGNATNVTLDDNHLFVLDNLNGVLQLNVQNPIQPVLTQEYTDTRLPIAAEVIGHFLYLLDIDSLQIIDTRSMHRQSRYTQLQSPTDLVVNDTAVYITDRFQLKTFRINTDSSKLAVEEIPTDSLPQTKPLISLPTNQLFQNHPNPFNPETWIPYSLANNSYTSLSIYNSQGRLVFHRSLGFQRTGKHTAYWHGRNMHGEPVASGVYYYTLTAGDYSQTRKMIVRR